MKRILLALTVLLASATWSFAEDIDVGGIFNSLNAKEGVMWNVRDGRFLNTLTVELAGLQGFSLNAAYVGSDGLGATVDYDLAMLPKIELPVLNLVQYLHLGVGAAYKTITLGSDTADGDNRLVWGPVVTFKLKF